MEEEDWEEEEREGALPLGAVRLDLRGGGVGEGVGVGVSLGVETFW